MPKAREFWRPVPGYEGYYEVSDLGRVAQPSKGRISHGREAALGTRPSFET